ncbi:MAG: SRPBCC family protein [archaeon]
MRATAETIVDEPRESCFEFLRDPANHPTIVPGVRRIDAESLSGADGYEGDFTYELAGVALDLHFRDVELDPPNRRAFEVTGPMEGRAVYELEAENGATRLTLEISYELPGPDVLESIADRFVRRYVENEARAWVDNAKAAIESRENEAA